MFDFIAEWDSRFKSAESTPLKEANYEYASFQMILFSHGVIAGYTNTISTDVDKIVNSTAFDRIRFDISENFSHKNGNEKQFSEMTHIFLRLICIRLFMPFIKFHSH